MPTLRTSEAIRADLGDVETRAETLTTREREATAELATAQTRHGELYASGADASTIKRQAAAVTALRVELDGIALGRSLLAQQREALTGELTTAEAAEAITAAHSAARELAGAVANWQEHAREVFGPGSPFDVADTALRGVAERARAATGVAIGRNPTEANTVEAAYREVWQGFPAPLFEAVQAYRNTEAA